MATCGACNSPDTVQAIKGVHLCNDCHEGLTGHRIGVKVAWLDDKEYEKQYVVGVTKAAQRLISDAPGKATFGDVLAELKRGDTITVKFEYPPRSKNTVEETVKSDDAAKAIRAVLQAGKLKFDSDSVMSVSYQAGETKDGTPIYQTAGQIVNGRLRSRGHFGSDRPEELAKARATGSLPAAQKREKGEKKRSPEEKWEQEFEEALYREEAMMSRSPSWAAAVAAADERVRRAEEAEARFEKKRTPEEEERHRAKKAAKKEKKRAEKEKRRAEKAEKREKRRKRKEEEEKADVVPLASRQAAAAAAAEQAEEEMRRRQEDEDEDEDEDEMETDERRRREEEEAAVAQYQQALRQAEERRRRQAEEEERRRQDEEEERLREEEEEKARAAAEAQLRAAAAEERRRQQREAAAAAAAARPKREPKQNVRLRDFAQ